MGHDIGQFIIVHGVQGSFVHTKDSAQAHECIDIFVRGYVYVVVSAYGSGIYQVSVYFLYPVVRFGRFVDTGLLLALGKELHTIVIVKML